MNIPKHVPKWTSATSKEQKNTQIGGKKHIAPKLILLSRNTKGERHKIPRVSIKFMDSETTTTTVATPSGHAASKWSHCDNCESQPDYQVRQSNQVYSSSLDISSWTLVQPTSHKYFPSILVFLVCLLFFNSSIKLKPNKVILLRNIYIEQASFLLVKNSILCHKTRAEKRRRSEGKNTSNEIPNLKYQIRNTL